MKVLAVIMWQRCWIHEQQMVEDFAECDNT